MIAGEGEYVFDAFEFKGSADEFTSGDTGHERLPLQKGCTRRLPLRRTVSQGFDGCQARRPCRGVEKIVSVSWNDVLNFNHDHGEMAIADPSHPWRLRDGAGQSRYHAVGGHQPLSG